MGVRLIDTVTIDLEGYLEGLADPDAVVTEYTVAEALSEEDENGETE